MIFARLAVAALPVVFAATSACAFAEEAAGCAAFKWPVESERAALTASTKPVLANGGAFPYGAAVSLKLQPLAQAGLPQPPERAPKAAQSYAGHFTLPPPAKPGLYKVTIGAEAWVDVVDNGAFLHPKGFSGAIGCDGARKIVRFDLPARPLNLQFSGVHEPELSAIVTPAQ